MSPSGSGSLLLALLAGCGDGLVDGTYAGEPVFTLTGVVRYEADSALPDDSLYVTVVWEPAESGAFEYVPALEVETTFPARYTLSIYAPPPETVLWDGGGGYMGVGVPLLYADKDGDAGLDPGVDELVGGTEKIFLLYLSTRFEQPATPEGDVPEVLEPGFHAVRAEGCPGEGPLFATDPAAVDLAVVGERRDPLEACGRE